MPVANRAWLRLTPTGAHRPARDYLKAQPPAYSAMEASLAVIALFIVICLGTQQVYAKWRSSRSTTPACPLKAFASEIVDKDTVKQGPGPTANENGSRGQFIGDAGKMRPLVNERARLAGEHAVQGVSSLDIDTQWNKSLDGSPRGLISRRPPAPPLTPPEPSTSVFAFTRSSQSSDSFMHQPNPDYMSSTESPTSQHSPSSSSGPRRRSYTRMIPSDSTLAQLSSPIEVEPADASLLSTSYPPTTSLLPPPPPGLQLGADDEQGRQIEVRGEIVSMLDAEGAGWTRHTRVYGGGICLACAATGGNHGGGFYGANVSPEEMH